jgi:hypothetical protein
LLSDAERRALGALILERGDLGSVIIRRLIREAAAKLTTAA